MADGGIGNQSPATLFQARLLTIDSVGPNLRLAQYCGNKVVVSGLTVSIPQTGLDRDIADNLIDAAGADAGAPPAASTLYYVYISNKRSPFSPESIRLSATAPSYVNGVKYLGISGNALNWRFVGWVRPNATPEFESSLTSRTIINYYNRFDLSLFVCPGYVNADAYTTYPENSAVYAPIHGGVDAKLAFISNGEDAVSYHAQISVITNGIQATMSVGVGEDSATTPAVTGLIFTFTSQQILQQSADKDSVLLEGFRELTMLFQTQVGPVDVYASGKHWGGAVDTPITYMTACISG